MIPRIFSNTKKHIARSGWVGWASVFVMTLAFLVVSIFGGLAYVSNLFIQYTENKSNLLVFFNVGMDREIVNRLKEKWQKVSMINEINYLSEEDAYTFYSDYAKRTKLDDTYQVLQLKEDKKLPSSLEIQINTLKDLDAVEKILKDDINVELEQLIILEPEVTTDTKEDIDKEETTTKDTTDTKKTDAEKTTTTKEVKEEIKEGNDVQLQEEEGIRYKFSNVVNEPPIVLSVNSETLTKFARMFAEIRFAGVIIMSLLILVVVFFIFMTTEFRLFNQMEEIGVMQLVGGSLGFIRAPYVLEGGFYGFMGALISSGLIGGFLFAVLELNLNLATSSYILENFYQLPWPHISIIGWLIVLVCVCFSGFFIGAASSYLSIRRYIR